MSGRSPSSSIDAVPALIACVAIAFGTFAAERKLDPPVAESRVDARDQPLLAPAPLARPVSGDSR